MLAGCCNRVLICSLCHPSPSTLPVHAPCVQAPSAALAGTPTRQASGGDQALLCAVAPVRTAAAESPLANLVQDGGFVVVSPSGSPRTSKAGSP